MNKIVIIRNAAKQDFGGGERIPVLIAKTAQSIDPSLSIKILSGSEKLLEFASSQQVSNQRSWWLPVQNWSGSRILLMPFYLVWQILLTFYYLVQFLILKPSLVHLQSKDDFIAGTLASKILGVKVVWSDYADLKHIMMNTDVWYKNPSGKLVFFASFLVDRIFVVSKEDRRLIFGGVSNKGFRSKCEVLYYGAFDYKANISKRKVFTFVASSRIVTDKGIGELIEAFTNINKKDLKTELMIIGDGPEEEKFKNLAKTNKSIQFIGFKTNPFKYIEESHVFIIPTYHEGFSIALVEACMLGMPIIATNVGGNPEIIEDGKNGLLVKAKDINSLEGAMERLLGDDNLRNKLGKSARDKYLKEFDLGNIIKTVIVPIYGGYREN